MSGKLSNSVGKKIVDALKQQAVETEIPVAETAAEDVTFIAAPAAEPSPGYVTNTIEPEISMPAIGQKLSGLSVEDDGFNTPANVKVLKQLMTQLPPGITKQTGAQIIRQTMEALGIPMKSVLQEAQAFQENLKALSDECQTNIAEYKKQIAVMETQIKHVQKESGILNDIISLFIQLT